MAVLQYGIKYNGVLKYSNNINPSTNGLHVTYDGSERANYTTEGSKTVPCTGKMMKTNLTVGAKEITCGGKVMNGNVEIIRVITEGSNYDIITTSKIWTCPPGVTSVTVVCVGGGAAGNPSFYANSGRSGAGGGGGAGGRVVSQSVSVTPGQQYGITIGAGGTPSAVPSQGQELFGGDGFSTSFASLASASGGESGRTSQLRGGNGGCGGGHGGSYRDNEEDSPSYTYADHGGSNGGSGFNPSGYKEDKDGDGQGTSTYEAITNIYYSGGGGGGSYKTAHVGNGGNYGGGRGGYSGSSPIAGTANSGGGGGGGMCPDNGGMNQAGGAGGSGICIIKW